MFGKFLVISILFILCKSAISQSIQLEIENESDSFMPCEALDDTIFLEQYGTLSLNEISFYLSQISTDGEKNQALRQIQYYNYVKHKDFNQITEENLQENRNLMISKAYQRDFVENIDSNMRFMIIRVDPVGINIINKFIFNDSEFFLYDLKTKTKYKNFYRVEEFLQVLKKSKKRFKKESVNKEEDFTAFSNKKMVSLMKGNKQMFAELAGIYALFCIPAALIAIISLML